jgi:hypothetical protein
MGTLAPAALAGTLSLSPAAGRVTTWRWVARPGPIVAGA